jgi:hypothetical protein
VQALGTDAEVAELAELVRDFSQNLGPKLHARLSEKASGSRNWLEAWWDKYAYLMWPDTIPPQESVVLKPDVLGRDLTQIQRAASVVHGSLLVLHSLESGSFPPNTAGGRTMCMYQYQ